MADLSYIKETLIDPHRAYRVRERVMAYQCTEAQCGKFAREAERIGDYLTALIWWDKAQILSTEAAVAKMVKGGRPAPAESYQEDRDFCEDMYGAMRKLISLVDKDLGFGKRMGDCLYLYYHYKDCIPQEVFIPAINRLNRDEPKALFNLLKWDRSNNFLSFLWSPDFLTSHEPYLQEGWVVTPDPQRKIKFVNVGDNPPIYHHRWMMVRQDFDGFDVVKSIRRSLNWVTLPNLPAGSSSRIGRRKFWLENVAPLIRDQ